MNNGKRDVTLICPACKSHNIKEGGFTGVYYWCGDCKDPRYSEAVEDNYMSFMHEGMRFLRAEVERLKSQQS